VLAYRGCMLFSSFPSRVSKLLRIAAYYVGQYVIYPSSNLRTDHALGDLPGLVQVLLKLE
jgi:hypothetical protein